MINKNEGITTQVLESKLDMRCFNNTWAPLDLILGGKKGGSSNRALVTYNKQPM